MMASMGEMTRRDVLAGVAALAAAGGVGVEAQTVGTGTGPFAASKVFTPVLVTAANGSQRWAQPGGALATGEMVGMHESVVPAGTPAPALHRITHSELVVVLEGTVEYQHDGMTETAQAGSVLYVAYGTTHAVRNAGTVAARYLVVQIGGDTK